MQNKSHHFRNANLLPTFAQSENKCIKWFKSNYVYFYLCLFRIIYNLGFHVQNLSLNHVQKAVFWKKSPHTVQVYKEEIPLFSLAFLALLACVTLWEWLCKPYTLKKKKEKGIPKYRSLSNLQKIILQSEARKMIAIYIWLAWCSWKTEAINMSQA